MTGKFKPKYSRVAQLKTAADFAKYLQDNQMENPSRTALIAKAQRTPLKLSEKESMALFAVLDEYESFYRNT
jgi:hypothetical protein